MSQTFVLKVNGIEKEIASVETQGVLRNALLVENPLSQSLTESLANTDAKGRKYSEFYPKGLLESGDAADVFELTIAGDKQIATGKATRQALYNRMSINVDKGNYETLIVKVSQGTDEKPAKVTKGKSEAVFA